LTIGGQVVVDEPCRPFDEGRIRRRFTRHARRGVTDTSSLSRRAAAPLA